MIMNLRVVDILFTTFKGNEEWMIEKVVIENCSYNYHILILGLRGGRLVRKRILIKPFVKNQKIIFHYTYLRDE